MPSKPFNPTAGDFISRPDAKAGIDRYKASTAIIVNQGIKAHYFGSAKITEVMNQADCVGIRIWYGLGPQLGPDMKPQLYIVGVDSEGNDILPAGQEKIVDYSDPCPLVCPGGTSLDGI